WESRTTAFGYDADSNNTTITFPEATSNKDTYAYNEADAMSEATFAKGATALASIEYTRNKNNQITKAKDKGLPGAESLAYSYDENSRLTKGIGLAYKYDSATNPTTIAGEAATYDAADELERLGTGTGYSYNELGERTKLTPTAGSSTTYEYNQAGVMTVASKSGGFEDSYAYNGDGLRMSQSIDGRAGTYDLWDSTSSVPLQLSDGTYTYVYGVEGEPIEEIAGATLRYLHHDAQGSTRLITSPTGEVAGAKTYDAYGRGVAASGTASSALGYDGQYTDPDTGLIYLRARYYDPATAQFLVVDPKNESTLTWYSYAGDDPIGRSDPTGEYETTPAEQRFAHEFSHALARVNRRLGKLSGPAVEIFEDLAQYREYVKLYDLAADPSLQAKDYVAYEEYKKKIYGKIYSSVAPLWQLSFDATPAAIVKTLLSVAAKAFGV
ncbi:MAG TPA: RHS repeat-associated core domain-containing protein, partial [Solirubrobacteraceae bacterium]|nr:RHS repeat-associated core domain-containing protein [Solirubrobacteraceae bacterium]